MTADRLTLAKQLIKANNYRKASKVLTLLLERDPDNVPALLLVTAMLMSQEQYVAAYHIGRRVAELKPSEPCAWINLSATCHRLWRLREADECFERGMVAAEPYPSARRMLMVNRSALLVDTGRWAEARPFAEAALAIDPNDGKAQENLGICDLAQGRWETGWKLYDQMLKPKRDYQKGCRLKRDYNGLPDWKGSGGRVVIYGEQGIGDIIAFASILPDAIAAAESVVVDVEPRLVGLFQRSFGCEVTTDYTGKADFACAIGQLGGLFRTNGEFPGKPYLKPCPIRRRMWQAELKSDRPVIGIAWTGGLPRTGDRFREWTADDMAGLLGIDATFVSLEYRVEEMPGIERYPFATSRTMDYDDTAALVACLDHVVCVQTAVGHLAAALGVPCTMFAAEHYVQWRDTRPWCDSMRVIRQTRPWKEELTEFASQLNEELQCQPVTFLKRI